MVDARFPILPSPEMRTREIIKAFSRRPSTSSMGGTTAFDEDMEQLIQLLEKYSADEIVNYERARSAFVRFFGRGTEAHKQLLTEQCQPANCSRRKQLLGSIERRQPVNSSRGTKHPEERQTRARTWTEHQATQLPTRSSEPRRPRATTAKRPLAIDTFAYQYFASRGLSNVKSLVKIVNAFTNGKGLLPKKTYRNDWSTSVVTTDDTFARTKRIADLLISKSPKGYNLRLHILFFAHGVEQQYSHNIVRRRGQGNKSIMLDAFAKEIGLSRDAVTKLYNRKRAYITLVEHCGLGSILDQGFTSEVEQISSPSIKHVLDYLKANKETNRRVKKFQSYNSFAARLIIKRLEAFGWTKEELRQGRSELAKLVSEYVDESENESEGESENDSRDETEEESKNESEDENRSESECMAGSGDESIAESQVESVVGLTTELPQSLEEAGGMHDRNIGQAESYERPQKRRRLSISMLLAAESPLQQAFLTPLPSDPIDHQLMGLARSVAEVVGADTSAPMTDAGIPSSSEKLVNDGVRSELLLPTTPSVEQHEFGTSQGGCRVADFTYAKNVMELWDDDAFTLFGIS